jgi:hypothetical protein
MDTANEQLTLPGLLLETRQQTPPEYITRRSKAENKKTAPDFIFGNERTLRHLRARMHKCWVDTELAASIIDSNPELPSTDLEIEGSYGAPDNTSTK